MALDRPKKIKFRNSFQPGAKFDLLRLEELFTRTFSDHDSEELHKIDFFIVLLITKGHGVHTIDFTEYPYTEGSLLTIGKDQLHRFHKKKGVEGYLLLFTDDFLVSYLEGLEARKTMQLFNELLGHPMLQIPKADRPEVLGSIQRIEHEYRTVADSHSTSIIRSELHILVSKLFRIKSKGELMVADSKYLPEFIRFQDLVESNILNKSRVNTYAQMMGVSSKTLNNITQAVVKQTAKEVIDAIWMTQIKRLLINTPLSVKQVALTMGFEETSNFYKYFKRHAGMTPESFRTKRS